MYSSGALSAFTRWGNHHGHPSAQNSSRLELCPHQTATLLPQRPPAGSLPLLLSVSTNGTALRTSFKLNHTVCVIPRAGLLPSASCPEGPSVLQHVAGMPFLLKAGQYSLAWIMTHCIYWMIAFIHRPWVDTWVAFPFWPGIVLL